MRRIGDTIGRTRLAAIVTVVALATLSLWSSSISAARTAPFYSGSLLENPLVVQNGDLLFAGQRQAALVAKRYNPQAVLARERSRVQYASLGATAAGRLLSRSLPAMVDQPAGGLPSLPTSSHPLAYRTTHAVELSLPGHRLGILESSAEIAKRGHDGRYHPTDLELVRAGSGYTPAVSGVPVKIPGSLSNGVGLPGTEVKVTPVNARGLPLHGRALDEHASVVYANTEQSTDTVIKPTMAGFQLDAALRSQNSPRNLYFAVGVARTDRVVQNSVDGVVRILSGHRLLATVLPPAAEDAAGASVPTSMRLIGHTLAVTVDHRAGSYLYPIAVDPEVNDNQLATTSTNKASNWEFHTSNSGRFAGKAVYEGVGKEHLETKGVAEYAATEWAYWGYETKGDSKIYELKAKTSAKNKGAKIESFLEFEAPGASEKPKKLLSTEGSEPEYSEKASTICAWNASKVEECLPGAGKEKNAVHFQQSATGSPGGSYGFLDTMSEGVVSISEPAGTHATTGYNTTSPELEFEVEKAIIKRKNALYGSGSWLSKFEGAIQMNSADPGIGVSATTLEYEKSPGTWTQLSRHEYLEKENGCKGVQCYTSHSEYWTLDPKLPNGEDKVRYRAEEAIPGTASLESEGQATVKVDASAPHGLRLQGLPYGDELTERPYELTGEATDGEGASIASSGVRSLALYVDGSQFGTSGGSCSVTKGECTATRAWTINGAELGAGHHAIVLVVFDNAGNEKRLELTITIRHSTPVPIGPGSVDLQSGDFTLSSTDVSLGSGLEVTRSYSSRAVNGPAGAAFGPQWSIGVGTTDSLVEMVDRGMLLTSANGAQSIFASLGGTEYESPVGDSNLTLKSEENAKKEKIAYYLTDSAKHTSVKFAQPVHGSVWVPTAQEGTVAGDTVTYSYGEKFEPVIKHPIGTGGTTSGLTAGPNKEQAVWFTNGKGSAVGRMTTGGALTEYAVAANSSPLRITVGPDNNLWFTEREGKNVGKITAGGVLTEYPVGGATWSIIAGPDGNVWFTKAHTIGKLTTSGALTEYSPLKETEPYGLTVGPDGNLWFTEAGAGGEVGKITPSGVVTEYPAPANSELSIGIAAGSDGNIWFAYLDKTSKVDKIAKMTTSGTILGEYSLGSSWVSSLVAGDEGNLWFSSSNTHTIGRITTSGAISEHTLPAISLAEEDVAIGPDENPWFTEYGDGVSELDAVTGTIPEPTEVSAPKPAGVSCSPEMKPGCRSLKMTYTELSEYRPRLTKVALDAYDPAAKAMKETAVAQYSYDESGRLRSEWDPRLGEATATVYGYDGEGHVTAVTPAGQESWAFTYGTSANDAGTGRLLRIARAPASGELWNGESLTQTKSPVISGKAVVGSRLAVSDGSWSGTPVTLGYQWKRCDEYVKSCSLIDGANNANYTPIAADSGYRLVAVVTATNGGGSTNATSAATAAVGASGEAEVPASEYDQTTITGTDLTSVSCTPATTECVIGDSAGNAHYTTAASAKSAVAWSSWTGPKAGAAGAISCPTKGKCLAGSGAKVYYATTLGGSWALAHSSEGNVSSIACPSATYCLVAGHSATRPALGNVSNPFSSSSWQQYTTSTSQPVNGMACVRAFGLCTMVDASGKLYSDQSRPETSPWPSASVSPKAELTGVACASEPCVMVDSAGNAYRATISKIVVEQDIDGKNKLTAVTCANTKTCVAVDNKGTIFVSTDTGDTWTDAYHLGEEELTAVSCSSASLCVTVSAAGKVTTFKASVPVGGEGEARPAQTATAVEYGVGLAGGAGLPQMTSGQVAKWGQTDDPVEATAILPPDASQPSPASNYTRATTYYLDEAGRVVNVSKPSNATYGSVSTTEYNELNDVVRELSPDNREIALEAGSESANVAKLRGTYYTYREECSKPSENKEEAEATPGARLCETEGPQHEIRYLEGSEQREALGRLHTKYFYDEKSPGGVAYNLPTKATTLAELVNEEEREVRKTVTSYSGQGNLGWTLRAPTSVTVDPEGKKITTTTVYNATTGQVSETRAPLGASGESARDEKFVYYSAEANTEGYPSCGGHPEWSGLTCETLPAKQPEAGTPAVPVTTITAYNMWNEPETTTETFGSTSRTKKETYDAAGRLSSSETSSTADVALPKLTNEYNSVTGVLERQSTTVEGKTKTITSKYNRLGQMIEYTDADGNTAKYVYGGPANDWLLEEVADGSDAGSGRQTYAYNTTTKLLEKLWDSAAGSFTAGYDAEGKLTSEVYPNAMCAKTAYDATGQAVHIEYIKTSNCSESGAPVWYSETIVPSARGEVYNRASTLASESYSYDSIGRLTETRETPAGEGCSERLYAYDEASNRTSQTTRGPGSGGKCATEGGTVLEHSYDEANRLKDGGIGYDVFGNVTKLPAADAEGHELTSTFYVDNAVATQSQNGVTNDYFLDPTGRVRETTTGVTSSISHYDGPGEAIAWTDEGGGKGTRDIPGIGGVLAATQANGETPVLQLHDLQGDVIATASLSGEATKLLSTYNSTEFGVPNGGKVPPKFAWLGAGDISSSLSSGVITYGATSYVPQVGRSLQSEEVAPPGLPEGSGAGAPYTAQEEPWNMQGAASEATEAPGLEAARERTAAEAAVSVVDPWHDTPMNRQKAEKLGEEFFEWEATAAVLSFYDLPSDFIDILGKYAGELVSQFSDALAWAHDAGEKLIKCAKNQRPAKENICDFHVDENELKLEILGIGGTLKWPNFSVEPRVEECKYAGSLLICGYIVGITDKEI